MCERKALGVEGTLNALDVLNRNLLGVVALADEESVEVTFGECGSVNEELEGKVEAKEMSG